MISKSENIKSQLLRSYKDPVALDATSSFRRYKLLEFYYPSHPSLPAVLEMGSHSIRSLLLPIQWLTNLWYKWACITEDLLP